MKETIEQITESLVDGVTVKKALMSLWSDDIEKVKAWFVIIKTYAQENALDINLDYLFELTERIINGEVSADTAKIVKEIMEAQELNELTELHEDIKALVADGMTYTWRDSEDDAYEEARQYLQEDDACWRMAVNAGNTTDGLDDWIENVLRMDGWESVLCQFDGQSFALKDGGVYWREN